jgi:hypothetical protein
VHEPPHARRPARVDHVSRPLDVDALQLPSRRVEAVERGHVEDGVAPGNGAFEPGPIAELDELVPHVGSLLAQLPRNVRADETLTHP